MFYARWLNACAQYNYSFPGSDSIYDLKQDLLSLTKEKYSTMLTVKKKLKELKFEKKQLESTTSPKEKQGTTYSHLVIPYSGKCWRGF